MPSTSGQEMAAVSADVVSVDNRPEGLSSSTFKDVPDEPANGAVQQNMQEPGSSRYAGPPGASQARSHSMPLIEQINNNKARSALQIRAQAARGNLRLPSFKSLGIGLPHPDHLLTPPDEADNLAFNPLAVPHLAASIPRSAPTLPSIPVGSNNQTTPPQDSESAMPEGSTRTQANAPPVDSSQAEGSTTQNISTGPILARHSSSSSEEDTPRGPAWLDRALDAVVTNVPTNDKGNTLVLCQCQPCPIATVDGPAITAFTPILEGLQSNLMDGQYIDVTHAVPPHFNMALLPSSPMGTPNPVSGQMDYFSMSVFSKAVVALHHDDVLKTPVPSSPHPIVPPNTVGVTLLERYIPPSTPQEFLDLFSMEEPSVLVDRLVELAPDGGMMVFIYPTLNGANAFASRYLGPLLDPLLRTMISIHGLTTDLSQEIGKMAAVDSMFSFEKLVRKITFLLPRLGRTTAGATTATRKYTLVQSSRQVVDIARSTWTEWWLQQEAPRIREVLRRYYKRGSRLPQRRDVTEGGLAREVLDGVKGRSYGPYDKPRDGIEVGVFVIKRSA